MEMERLMLGCLGRLTNESMAATTKKKASKHTPAGERHGEKAKFFFHIFFGRRIRTSKKRVWRKKPTHTHAEGKASRQAQRKERRKKRLVEADGGKKKKSITYYIKSIFSRWTHNRKKIIFECERFLLFRVAPIELKSLSFLLCFLLTAGCCAPTKMARKNLKTAMMERKM